MQKPTVFLPRFAMALAIAAMPVLAFGQSDSMSNGSSNNMGQTSNMGQASTNKHLTMSDKKFVRDAAQGGMAEVELGKLATEKASSDDVKKFGQRMVDDHSKANDELKQVAESEGIQVPDKLNAKDEATKERLSKLSGEQFDRAYMRDMVRDHTQDVADFKRESTNGSDPQVKDFAAKTLPTLQSHLREAEKIAPKSSTSANNMKGSQ
jgi:putative membrane protein